MSDMDNGILLERYKHVLTQMARIDENAHKFLALYQTIATALVGGIVALWLGHEKLGISLEQARDGAVAGILLIAVAAVLTIALIVVGAFAWMDYRREESALTTGATQLQRPPGSWRHMWRWQETYMVLLVLGMSVALTLFTWLWILPDLDS